MGQWEDQAAKDGHGDDDDDGCRVLMKLPERLRRRLLPFQKQGVTFAVHKHGRCLIADEMGLGKTLQAISVAYIYRDEWPLLIIVPSSLKYCWIEELEKWLPDILPHEINLVQSGGDISGMSTCPITIITYGLLRLPSNNIMREALAARRFQVVICDESHYLKNINTLSCKTVVPLLKSANRRILLSGTPALARPVELYPQVDALCPGQFGTYWQYTEKFCDAWTVHFGKFKKRQVNGCSNLAELQHKLQNVMIRREKADVLTELPAKQRQRILFELKSSSLKKEIVDMFSELKRKLRKADGTIQTVLSAGLNMDEPSNLSQTQSPAGDKSTPAVFSLISQLYRLSGEAKIGPVREYMEMLCEDDQLKFLVFAYHHNMMDGIQQTLAERKVKFVRIDGHTKSCDRQAYVSQFQSDSQTRVAILSILAAGVGLTLTAAKLVVFAELYWTPGVMAQCEDRAHRIGQTSSLPVHYLVAKDTMDEWVWSSVCKKTLVTSTVLTGTTKPLDHVPGEDYQVQLLSNADVWKPEEDSSQVDVSQLVRSQRPHDQSSILEFFTSQHSPKPTGTHKRWCMTSGGSNPPANEVFNPLNETNQKLQLESSEERRKRKRKQLEEKISEVIIISDEEGEFKLSRTSKKAKRRHVDKRALKDEGKQTNKHGYIKDGCQVVQTPGSDTLPNFNLYFFEDLVSASDTSCGAGEDSVSVQPGGGCSGGTRGVAEVIDPGIDDSNNSSSLSDTSFFTALDNKCQVNSPEFVHRSTQFSVPQVMESEFKATLAMESDLTDSVVRDEQLKDTTMKDSQIHSSSVKGESHDEHLLVRSKKCQARSESPAASSMKQLACSSPVCQLSSGQQVSMSEVGQGDRSLRDESQHKVVVDDSCGQWSCSRCTFFNHLQVQQCEMCDTPQKMSSSRPQRRLGRKCLHLEDGNCHSPAKYKPASRRHKLAVGEFANMEEENCGCIPQTAASSQTLKCSSSPQLTNSAPSKRSNKASASVTETSGGPMASASITPATGKNNGSASSSPKTAINRAPVSVSETTGKNSGTALLTPTINTSGLTSTTDANRTSVSVSGTTDGCRASYSATAATPANRVLTLFTGHELEANKFTALKMKSANRACESVATHSQAYTGVVSEKTDGRSIHTDTCAHMEISDSETEIAQISQKLLDNLLSASLRTDVSKDSSGYSDLLADFKPQVHVPNMTTADSSSVCQVSRPHVGVPGMTTADSSSVCQVSRPHVHAPGMTTADSSSVCQVSRPHVCVPGMTTADSSSVCQVSRLPVTEHAEDSPQHFQSATNQDCDSGTDYFPFKPLLGAAPDLESQPQTSTLSALVEDDVPPSPPLSASSVDEILQSVELPSHGHPPAVSSDMETSVTPDLSQRKTTKSGDQLIHGALRFTCSSHTGRIFVFDEDGQFLQASFQPIDVELANTDELPQILQQQHHLRLVQKFVREWNSLTDTKKRLVAKRCQTFTSPLAAYEGIRTVHGSTQRHLSKRDVVERALQSASHVQGSVRLISRQHKTLAGCQKADSDQGQPGVARLAQVVTQTGAPLCLQCHKPVESPLLSAETLSNPQNAWQLRLCSFECMDKYWTLSKGSYCRQLVFETEHGVCQLCRFDAHQLFTHIKVTKSVKARAEVLMRSPYQTLSQAQRQKVIQEPQAGQFWHVDHVVPVWQGGGMCDLDNLRTLCTPCHMKVTRRQAGQRAMARKLGGRVAVGSQADITAFFQRS